jgi:hypothetical protein
MNTRALITHQNWAVVLVGASVAGVSVARLPPITRGHWPFLLSPFSLGALGG